MKPKSLECEWDKVRHALEKCSPELHDSIDKLYNDAPASKQSKLKAILASYSYGELVVSEGIPYLPNQQKFPKDFIISSSLPLGIIVKGTMDIVDSQPTNPSRNNKESASIAQLFEGDMMGIFEALDYSGVGKSYAQPEWTIYAGINSILPIVDINTDGRAKKLNRLYKADITKTNFDNKKLFGQSASEIHKILYENYAHISEDSKLKNLYTECFNEYNSWKLDLIYLNKYWVDIIFENCTGKEYELSALNARNYIKDKAWESVTTSREIHSASEKYIRQEQEEHQVKFDPYKVFEFIIDVTLGRKPLYIYRNDGKQFAPMKFIESKVFMPAEIKYGVMCPVFISSESEIFMEKHEERVNKRSIGFVPFSQFLPIQKSKSEWVDILKRSLQMILHSSQKLPEGNSVPFLRNFKKIIPHITIKYKADGQKFEYQKPRIDNDNKIIWDKIKNNEFYENGDICPIETESKPFFTHCIKIDLNKFSWDHLNE